MHKKYSLETFLSFGFGRISLGSHLEKTIRWNLCKGLKVNVTPGIELTF